jgi:hypothetical protein
MNLISGCLAISLIIPGAIVTHELEAQAAAVSWASLADEHDGKYSTHPNGLTNYQVFRSEQEKEQQPDKLLDQWPMECEGAATRLDFAVINTRKLEGTYLILVARLGSGEVSRSLNQTRLKSVEQYVLRSGADLKYVLAQGSRLKGLGRVEVYVGGQLVEIMPLRKNAKGFCAAGRA